MTEKEIREVIRELCEDLDRRARRAVKDGLRKVVLPSMLGAGLALAPAGCDDRAVPGTDQKVVPRADAAYGVPFDGRVKTDDSGAIPPYMAPDAGPQPEYMRASGRGRPVSRAYMAPDAGPTPRTWRLPSRPGRPLRTWRPTSARRRSTCRPCPTRARSPTTWSPSTADRPRSTRFRPSPEPVRERAPMIELLSRLGYYPRFCVWELTLACNLRCLHCGSFAGDAPARRARPRRVPARRRPARRAWLREA